LVDHWEWQEFPRFSSYRGNVETIMVNHTNQELNYVYRKYAALCIELKQLYVAITRPKKRLIIYDEDTAARLPIQRMWEALKIANIVTSSMIER
jgi:hypothetical protein